MKTLVIHPIDSSTNFLSEIYSGEKDWTIVRAFSSKKNLKDKISQHDRIIMLGHGSEDGLFHYNSLVIDATFVDLLKDKLCYCIWCNADIFVKKHIENFNNSGTIYTGMIISEPDEAVMYCQPFRWEFIKESNELFAKSIKESIQISESLDYIKKNYNSKDNPIIQFNAENIYKINLDN